MNLAEALHKSQYVYYWEEKQLVIAWYGGSTFPIFTVEGEEIDVFSVSRSYNIQLREAVYYIEQHVEKLK